MDYVPFVLMVGNVNLVHVLLTQDFVTQSPTTELKLAPMTTIAVIMVSSFAILIWLCSAKIMAVCRALTAWLVLATPQHPTAIIVQAIMIVMPAVLVELMDSALMTTTQTLATLTQIAILLLHTVIAPPVLALKWSAPFPRTVQKLTSVTKKANIAQDVNQIPIALKASNAIRLEDHVNGLGEKDPSVRL